MVVLYCGINTPLLSVVVIESGPPSPRLPKAFRPQQYAVPPEVSPHPPRMSFPPVGSQFTLAPPPSLPTAIEVKRTVIGMSAAVPYGLPGYRQATVPSVSSAHKLPNFPLVRAAACSPVDVAVNVTDFPFGSDARSRLVAGGSATVHCVQALA